MTNIFQDVLTDSKNVKDSLIGPDYPYWKNIKDPSSIGMTDEGNLPALARDIDGLIQYVEVLVTGGGASTTGGPLGNKFFLQTGAKCKDIKSGNEVDRYIYINNVPMGNVPFISSGLGTNFSTFKGLIPGTMENLNALNPYTILSSFMSGSVPDCQDTNNVSGQQTHFVTTTDISNMDPCNWSDGKNPVNKKNCKQAFTGMQTKNTSLPPDPVIQFYFASLGVLGIYILYCIMMKKNK